MRRLLSVVVCALAIACGSQDLAVEDKVARIGAARLVEAAQSVRASPKGELPEASWPDAIRSLEPRAVLVRPEGVFVRLSSRFTSESGVLITFDGATVSTEPGQDPAFEKVADGIYRYEVKG